MSRLKEIHQDFSNGLTDVTAKEMLMFIMWFKSYEPNIDNLKNKFDWYYEQYNQMIESDGKDFADWLGKEVSRQRDLIEHN